MSSNKLETADVINEIQDLQFIMQQWIRGSIDQDFTKITSRQAIDMTVVSSTGQYQTREEFNTRYRGYFGKHKKAVLKADIIRTKRVDTQAILVVYLQHSKLGKEQRKRMTTALFRYNSEMRYHAQWCHVHVTQSQS